MKKYEVLGFTYEEAEEMEKELNISIDFDMGVVGLSDSEGLLYEEIEPKLLAYIKEKYGVVIPEKVDGISADGDQLYKFQDLGFYWGLIYEKVDESSIEKDSLTYIKEGYIVHDDHIDFVELSNIDFRYPMEFEYRCQMCEDDGLPYLTSFSENEVSKYVLTYEEAQRKL